MNRPSISHYLLVANSFFFWATTINAAARADGECCCWVKASRLDKHLLLVLSRAIGAEAAVTRIAAPRRLRPLAKLVM
ncbi:MAG: hypothetical protein ACOYNZ_16395 [Rhodoferax sp.]